MSFLRLASVSAAAFILSVALLGCAPEAVESPEKTASGAPVETVEPAPDEEPQPEPAAEPVATVLPASCEEILSPDEVTAIHESLVPSAANDPAYHLQNMLGPKAWGALSSSDEVMMCGWGINNSGAIAAVGIAVIDDATKADLVAALRDSTFTETSVDGADSAFVQGQSFEHQWTDEIVFDGDALIASSHTISGDFSAQAHQRVRELNPALSAE